MPLEILFGLSRPKLAFSFIDEDDVVSYIRERESNVHSLFLSKPRFWGVLELEASFIRRFGRFVKKINF